MAEMLPRVDTCQNCGTPTDANFCPVCGQDSRDHAVSMRLLLGDFIGDVFTFDSRFFRSFVPLLIKPGALTADYMRGRRVGIIPPLRLYLFVSIAFFFILSLQVRSQLEKEGVLRHGGAAGLDSTAIATVVAELDSLPASASAGVEDRVREVRERLARRDSLSDGADDGTWTMTVMGKPNQKVDSEMFTSGILKLAPKGMFVLLPLFAAILALIYRRSHRPFIEHMVFSLHYHAFLYLVFAAAMLVDREWLMLVVLVGFHVYLYLALRRVYRQGWGKTTVKFFLLTGAYNTILVFVLVGVALSSIQLIGLSREHPMLVEWLMR